LSAGDARSARAEARAGTADEDAEADALAVGDALAAALAVPPEAASFPVVTVVPDEPPEPQPASVALTKRAAIARESVPDFDVLSCMKGSMSRGPNAAQPTG
jgi:hypothetical protein